MALRPVDFRGVAFLSLLALAACGEDEDTSTDTADTGTDTGNSPVVVSSNIAANTTWATGTTVELAALVFVESGVTLTIEPGVTIKGDNGSALVISRGARIDAVGTAEAPIVFTSSKPEGARQPGDWGGVVLLGAAPINAGAEGSVEGMEASALSAFGGTDGAHDCGTISFARIEFAGFTFGTDNELNGLTLAGCGSETSVDHVQVHKGKDDGVEVFGGSPNLKHLLITQAADDSLDWDMGFTGKVQFLAVQQNAGGGDKGVEADNLKDAIDATPRSLPTIYNATFVGSGTNPEQGGLHIRRGSGVKLANSIITGFAAGAIDFDGAGVQGLADAGDLTCDGLAVYGNGTDPWAVDASADDDGGFDESAWFANAGRIASTSDAGLGDPNNLTAPDMVPATAAAVAGAVPTPAGDSFFEATDYIGAFAPGAAAWTDGWTAFPEN
jgi:hypothetical protein